MLLNNNGLLVSVFDKVSKPRLSRFTPYYLLCNLPNAIFQKSQYCAKRKETSHTFFRATSRRQSGLFVYQITMKTYKMPQSYHSLKSKNILKILN